MMALSHLHKLSPVWIAERERFSLSGVESKPDHISTSDDLPVCLFYETANTQLILAHLYSLVT